MFNSHSCNPSLVLFCGSWASRCRNFAWLIFSAVRAHDSSSFDRLTVWVLESDDPAGDGAEIDLGGGERMLVMVVHRSLSLVLRSVCGGRRSSLAWCRRGI